MDNLKATSLTNARLAAITGASKELCRQSLRRTFDSFPSKTPPAFRPPNGTWFDEALDLRDPEGDTLTKFALDRVAVVEKRKRKRRKLDNEHHYAIVRKILANGFRCHFYRTKPLVAYHRRAAEYQTGPRWLSGESMARSIDLLESAGLVKATKGQYAVASSTFSVSEALVEAAEAQKVTSDSLTYLLPSERLVRLREGNHDTPYVAFTSTDETSCWTAQIEAYNAFLAKQDIQLDLSPSELRRSALDWTLEQKRGDVPYARPELFRTGLYRTFNNRSFEEGGRLYGGWWIRVPSNLRPRITINGKETVELDYSGCAIRMLYHEKGIDYMDDPYELDEITKLEKEQGLPSGFFREAIKGLVQALINDKKGNKPEQIKLPGGASFAGCFTRREVRQFIETKHAAISDSFGTGAGLRLQRKDSDIALSIISELMKKEIVALPVHDSFIVQSELKDILRSSMLSNYKEVVLFDPIIN